MVRPITSTVPMVGPLLMTRVELMVGRSGIKWGTSLLSRLTLGQGGVAVGRGGVAVALGGRVCVGAVVGVFVGVMPGALVGVFVGVVPGTLVGVFVGVFVGV